MNALMACRRASRRCRAQVVTAFAAASVSELDRGRAGPPRGGRGGPTVEYAPMAGRNAQVLVVSRLWGGPGSPGPSSWRGPGAAPPPGGAPPGATSVEYALMVGLIALVIVVSVTLFGTNVITLFDVPSSVFNP